MKFLITLLAALSAVGSITGQQGPVYQPVSFPLSGYIQPLTFPTLPNTNVYQAQGQQQTLQQTQQQTLQQTQQQPVPITYQQPSTASATTGQQQQQPLQPQPGPSAVVNNIRADGTYAFGYQTPDGQLRAESVQADGTRVGSYTYKTPDGQSVTINYTAGKHGFQATPGATVPANTGTAIDGYGSSVASPPAATSTSYAATAAVASVPAVAPASSTITTGTGAAVQPFVLYSPSQQFGYPSYYPFNSFSSQSTSVQQASSNTETQPAAQNQAANTVPVIGSPVGFSYGSNPQAIQQLQRLLLV